MTDPETAERAGWVFEESIGALCCGSLTAGAAEMTLALRAGPPNDTSKSKVDTDW